MRAKRAAALASVLAPLALPVLAARPDATLPELPGADLSLAWGIPFAGLLLSIALAPLASPRFWHAHYGKIALAWALALLVPLTLRHGAAETLHHVVHAIVLEYVPFVVILFSLFTIAGGICVHGALSGTPSGNTALLGLGAALASLIGTTGASMLLIRPLLAANESRRHKVHAVLMSGLWESGIAFDVFGARIDLENLGRDGLLIALALARRDLDGRRPFRRAHLHRATRRTSW